MNKPYTFRNLELGSQNVLILEQIWDLFYVKNDKILFVK